MRKALHEEVSKEITDKSVHIAVKMAKPVLDDFMKALSDAVKKPVKAAGHAIGQKIHPTEGKQSVKTLIRQPQAYILHIALLQNDPGSAPPVPQTPYLQHF